MYLYGLVLDERRDNMNLIQLNSISHRDLVYRFNLFTENR